MNGLICTLLLLVAAAANAQPSRATDSPLSAMEAFDPAESHAALERLIDRLDRELTSIDDQTWARLMAVVEDPHRPLALRRGVFSVAVKKAGPQQAADVLDRCTRWIEAAAAWRDPARRPIDPAPAYFLAQFVPLVAEEPWRSWIGSNERTVEVLTRVVQGDAGIRRGMLPKGVSTVDVLANLPAAPALLSLAAERIIASDPRSTSTDERLCRLLSEESRAALRAHVAGSGADPLDFHYGAAAALAHLGDRDLLPTLYQLKETYLASGPSVLDGREVAAGPQVARAIDNLIQQIEAQHPPESLLSMTDGPAAWMPHEAQRRQWALRRAAELRVDRARVRQAVLAQAESLRAAADAARLQGDRRAGLISVALSQLKADAAHLGFLEPSDLPDVPAPPSVERR